ncbi:hypothetical protein CKJ81_10605 [Corynebacterium hadale]|uniref:Uncharacterized protein n=1 Tax=Corynebacterium hadale TaxID=2026255 RepID=A0ABX4H7L0_9CORY|nr:hypothetical protein [Corynebacterium hadale]PAT05298.1 hypothetical protein CKJ81_10605 [Corynebacterium hadale]
MRLRPARAAVAALTAIALACAGAPGPAAADITQSRFSVQLTTGAPSGFHTVDVNKGRVSWLTFNHPNQTVRVLQDALSIDATAAGTQVSYAGDDTEVTEGAGAAGGTGGAAETVTLTHRDDRAQVEMVRTFRVSADSVEVDVQLRNLAQDPRELSVDLAHGTLDSDFAVTSDRDGDALDLHIGEAYQLRLDLAGAQRIGTGADRDAALAALAGSDGPGSDEPGTDARYQAGRFAGTVAPGESLHARATLTGTADDRLNDTDGDGFPDVFEAQGFTTADGTEFPLNAWGLDPNRPDLLLQLNWMKSEWETLGCATRRAYAPTPADFAAFTACSRANTNTYRPSRATLNQLVEVFDRQGINLLIDAGAYYTNIPAYTDFHGGPTEDYAEYYFGGASTSMPYAAKLLAERDRLLGDRAGVFRVGVIGGQQAPGDLSSGTGLVRDGSFFVSKNELMTSQEQLRNSILHEYGHNLGLTHSGAYNVAHPDSAYVPNYRSVMNYLYQFAYFDYSDTEARPDAAAPLPRACTDGSVTCYDGDYDIAPDWDHIELVNGRIGTAQGTAGTSTAGGEETSHRADVTVRDLEKHAAEHNNGKAGFRVLNDPDSPNVIVANRTDSTVRVELSNLGSAPHRFRVQASYPGGEWSDTVQVASALSSDSKRTVTVPIAQTAGYRDATMPIQFRVYNEDGRLVADETQDFSVLTYTKAQMQSLIDELQRTRSPLLADAQAALLGPGSGSGAGQGAATPAPVPTRPNSALPTPTRAPGVTDLAPASPAEPASPVEPAPAATASPAGGSSSTGIAIAVVLALLAALGIGAGVAAQAGLL